MWDHSRSRSGYHNIASTERSEPHRPHPFVPLARALPTACQTTPFGQRRLACYLVPSPSRSSCSCAPLHPSSIPTLPPSRPSFPPPNSQPVTNPPLRRLVPCHVTPRQIVTGPWLPQAVAATWVDFLSERPADIYEKVAPAVRELDIHNSFPRHGISQQC